MSNIGILIETGDDGVKEANFGVITAARGNADGDIHAFILDGSAEGSKETLASYGVAKVVALGAEGGDLHPALLLPPAHEGRRRLPRLPGRSRRAAWHGARAVVHDTGR